jgi:hypothetical protein
MLAGRKLPAHPSEENGITHKQYIPFKNLSKMPQKYTTRECKPDAQAGLSKENQQPEFNEATNHPEPPKQKSLSILAYKAKGSHNLVHQNN